MEELKGTIGCGEYYFSLERARVQKLIAVRTPTTPSDDNNESGPTPTSPIDETKVVVRDGVKLWELLRDKAANNKWEVLADVWTELIIYLAPSSEEERVMGHA
jgi:hypothetical protein